MTNEIDNFYVRARKLIVPGSYQRSSYLSKVLEDIGAGFDAIDAYTAIASGSSTTIASTGNRNVFVTGNNLTHQVNLPSAPTAANPPVRVYNFGTGNVVTISGNGNKIMSGNTAGEITLRCPGDYIELRYINSTIGWGIMAINSNRIATVSATGSLQLHRFQRAMIDMRGSGIDLALHGPTDKQEGDILDISVTYNSASGEASECSLAFGDGTESVMGAAAAYPLTSYIENGHSGLITIRAWRTSSTWLLSTYIYTP